MKALNVCIFLLVLAISSCRISPTTTSTDTGASQVESNSNGRWSTVTLTGAPVARRFHSAVWTGAKMIVFGGADETTDSLNTGGAYDPVTNEWTELPTLNAPALQLHTAVWTGSRMLVVGDDVGKSFNPETNSWSDISSINAPSARRQHSAIWTGTKMVIWGGADSETGARLDSGAIYDPMTDTWEEMTTTNAPSARYQHVSIWNGDYMFIWGGRNDLNQLLRTGALYNPVSDVWASVSQVATPLGALKFGFWFESKGFVIPGNPFGFFDANLDEWEVLTENPGIVNHSYSDSTWTLCGDKFYTWGGLSTGGDYPQQGAVYDTELNEWTTMTTVNAPLGRRDHTAVCAGNSLIFWGGVQSYTPLMNSGGIYTP